MNIARTGLTLAIGAGGGWLFYLLTLPLPWMLGSMVACLVASVAGAPVVSVRPLRDPWVVVIGLMLGTTFDLAIFDGLNTVISLLGIVAAIVLMTAGSVAYLRKAAGFDFTTAYFASMPGGVYEMTSQGERAGGDVQRIALLQGARVFLVVLMVPISFRLLGAIGSTADLRLDTMVADAQVSDYAVLAACGALGWLLARVLRLPNAPLVGPLLLAATAHALGVLAIAPPYVLVCIAQIVVGSSIGGQFIGARPDLLLRTMGHALVIFVLAMAIALAVAFGTSMATGRAFGPLLLILAPGGIAEMSLIALALGTEVAFVAFHQIVRLLIVQMAGPVVFRILRIRPR